MPIAVERIEPRIYLSVWQEHISADDMQAAALRRKALADEDRAPSYVYIVDVTAARSVPFNLEALRGGIEIDERVIKFVVIGVGLQVHILIASLVKLTKLKVEFADSREAAIARARAILNEHDRQTPPGGGV